MRTRRLVDWITSTNGHLTLVKFRWHDGSLSVGGRNDSVAEAGVIRIAALPTMLRAIAPVWEIPIRWAILKAGNRLNLRSTRS